MNHIGNSSIYDSMFAKIADEFHQGIVESGEPSNDSLTIRFLDDAGDDIATCRIRLMEIDLSSCEKMTLVEVIGPEDSVVMPIYVSNLTSAIIAVCVR